LLTLSRQTSCSKSHGRIYTLLGLGNSKTWIQNQVCPILLVDCVWIKIQSKNWLTVYNSNFWIFLHVATWNLCYIYILLTSTSICIIFLWSCNFQVWSRSGKVYIWTAITVMLASHTIQIVSFHQFKKNKLEGKSSGKK